MKTRFEKIVRRAGHVLGAMLLSVSLTACLPQSDVADDFGSAGGAAFSSVDSQAGAMATNVSQLAFDVQSAVVNSTAWVQYSASAVPGGSFANMTAIDQASFGVDNLAGLNDGTMSAGYCDLDPAADQENNVLVTWFTNPGGGDFAVKGLGTNATSSIMQALSTNMNPDTIGVNGGTTVELAGPRSNGATTVDLAACNLGIPSGVPVVFFENIRRDMNAAEKTILVYETETQACNNDQVGGITRSVEYVMTLDQTGTKTPTGNSTVISDTCSEAMTNIASNEFSQTQVASISSAMINAAGGEQSDLGAILSDLNSLDCVQMSRDLLSNEGTDPNDPNAGASQSETISTCDSGASAGTVQLVESVVADLDGEDITMQTLSLSCGEVSLRSDTTFIGQHGGINGTATAGSWQGTILASRSADTGDLAGVGDDLMHRSAWSAGDVDCTREERLEISCASAFPAYNAGGYTMTSSGGIVLTRTNRVNSWANAANFEINKGLEDNAGWAIQSVDCAWTQNQSFTNCPSGFSSTQTGQRSRPITATSWGNTSTGGWVLGASSTCSRTVTGGSACPPAAPPTNTGDDAP